MDIAMATFISPSTAHAVPCLISMENAGISMESSLPATRFHFAKMNIAMKKCVACQRKSSLYDRVRTFFVLKRQELKQNGGKQQDEGDAGE